MYRKNDWPLGVKGCVGIVGCVIGLSVVYFGYGIGTESPKKDAAAEPVPASQAERNKPVYTMNLALGNMVYFARDLGFLVKNAKGEDADATKIAARIESQLHGIRDLYRQEIIKKPALAGSLTLTFNIGPTGEVSQVREISARLQDDAFTSAVGAEVSKWSFAQIVAENLNVACTLLFVHEGMDITTLVRWEKSQGNLPDKLALARSAGNAEQNSARAAAKSIAVPAAKPAGRVFQTKYAASLRKKPNFSAVSVTTFTIGTKVTILGKQGDWLEVRSADTGLTGFIRKEFVTPVDVARR